jgi:hypothetical protein
MAIIKVTNSKATLNKAINYITKEEKTELRLISGQDCNPSTALEEMQATKEQFNKLDGRQYYHYIQSFAKTENISHAKAHEIAKEWAEENFKGFEVLIATHQDKDHIHTHFIVNSVSNETGMKFHSSKKDLEHFKEISNKICEREGLSIVKEKSQNPEHFISYNQGKYRMMYKLEQGIQVNSYLFNTALAVDKSIETSKSRVDFIKAMKDQGYEAKWSDTNKNVTFKDKEGHKARLSNLQKTFNDKRFTKEELENGFRRVEGKELTKSAELGRIGGNKSRGTDRPANQAPRAEHESQNGVREHTPEREFGDIEKEIRGVELGVKGNPKQNAQGNKEQFQSNDVPGNGIENNQPNGERDNKRENGPVKREVHSGDWELER